MTLLSLLALGAVAITPIHLKCEYQIDPLGIDATRPRLSWELEAAGYGAKQTAYQVRVATTPLKLSKPDLWDSLQVTSGETINLEYGGRALSSSERVSWSVRVWDEHGKASPWSPPATWTMGVLSPADWEAKWIAAAGAEKETLELQKVFKVRPGLRRALAHVCGLGQYELAINGDKVGEEAFSPGWTNYRKTCLYDTRDITRQLRRGDNIANLLLGNGMYRVHGGRYTKFTGSFGPLCAIGQIRLEYADGTTDLVGTDETWQCRPGPITFSSVYGGEDYDGRRVGVGDWEPVRIIKGPGGELHGSNRAAPPINAFDLLKPKSSKEISSTTDVYDMGQNASLMPFLVASGPAGSIVRITPAELVKEDGTVDRSSVGGGQAYWQYTLAGKGKESYFPHFFYHGCRYLQVERIAADNGDLPTVQTVEAVVVHSASPAVGTFDCSNQLFNRIHTLVRWAQRSNMVSVLTDCPHRERLGWLEQYHLNGPALRYEFDLARLFEKGMSDMADSQLASGLIPDIAPEYTVFQGGFRDSPEWGSAYVLVPWQQYLWTGDIGLLRRHYDGMKRYVAYLQGKSKNGIVSHGLGDWYDLGPGAPGYAQLTPIPLTATAFFYQDTVILAQVARRLELADDAVRLERQAAEIRSAFNREFYDPTKGYYATGSQTANAIPLVMGLAERENRSSVLGKIVADVRDHGDALTAGDVGYRYLLRALADGDRSDVVFDMNKGDEHPGYGYQLKMGATSLTEAWDAGRSSSQNHFMLGQINEWFYHDLAGIAPSEVGPGFRHIVFHPAVVGDIKWVDATFASVRGMIESHWKVRGKQITYEVLVPPNCTADIYVPSSDAKSVRVVTGSAWATSVAEGVYHVPAGRYVFTADAP
ncbi:alpha-L-rhamnosidase [Fimbriimonas ginsengisoli]|uniref:alpha-L-rhamnosidase n=1 Tax=Fimbriimonas ginsengisoli Gsoil 348 TaxID=661478 RepID=A0A068NVB4_FIMGI|nr:alpha-L-rhamnosidase [Fimbriimonas ginsengisoli]AIE85514.1 rhamnosidase [Fimbriimonas ginsengisoli Gsoil 348]